MERQKMLQDIETVEMHEEQHKDNGAVVCSPIHGNEKVTVEVVRASRYEIAQLLNCVLHGRKRSFMEKAGKQGEYLPIEKLMDPLAIFQIRSRSTPHKKRRLIGLIKKIEDDISRWDDELDKDLLLDKGLLLRSFKLRYLAEEGELFLRKTMDEFGVYISHQAPKNTQEIVSLKHPIYRVGTTDIYLHVLLGDILFEPTNVIVNSVNGKLNQKGGVAGSIAACAGPEMIIEGNEILAKLESHFIPAGSAVVTEAYNIKIVNPSIEYVVHAVASPKNQSYERNQYYRKAIRSALQKAHEKSAVTVSLPLFGAGLQNQNPQLCAEQIILALAEWIGSKHNQTLTLKKVIFIDKVEKNVHAIVTALEDFAKNRQFVIDKMLCPHHVIAEMLTMSDVTDVAAISVVPDSVSQEEFSILGTSSNVVKAKKHVEDQLNNAFTFKILNLQDEGIKTSKEQVYSDLHAKFASERLNVFLSPLVDNLQSIELCSFGEININKSLLIINRYLRECERAIQWPESWPKDFDTNFVGHYRIPVRKFSEDWLRISDVFRGRPASPMGSEEPQNIFINEITNIEMIINPTAFRAYYRYAEELANRNVDAPQDSSTFVRANEWWMKHGSGNTEPSEIADSDCGLNFNFHTESNRFGRGAYMAEDASYVNSCRKFEHADGIHAQMFLVRVAAGVIREEQSYSENHKLLKDAPRGFNSIRGPISVSYMGIVTYRQNSTYPAYLITYKRTI